MFYPYKWTYFPHKEVGQNLFPHKEVRQNLFSSQRGSTKPIFLIKRFDKTYFLHNWEVRQPQICFLYITPTLGTCGHTYVMVRWFAAKIATNVSTQLKKCNEVSGLSNWQQEMQWNLCMIVQRTRNVQRSSSSSPHTGLAPVDWKIWQFVGECFKTRIFKDWKTVKSNFARYSKALLIYLPRKLNRP